MSGVARQPLGADLTLAQLDADPHGPLAELRDREPVSWVPALDGWLVTRRDLCIEVRTVKNHVHNLLEKLRVRHRGEAAARLRSARVPALEVLRGSGAGTRSTASGS